MSIDFPRAWQLARAVPMSEHHFLCSYRVSEGGVLCDCDVVYKHPECLDDVLHSTDGHIFVPKENSDD